jgi:hypothetical protein
LTNVRTMSDWDDTWGQHKIRLSIIIKLPPY